MTSQFAIRLAAHHIRNSGIIIYPTETVYGLGCDPGDQQAVKNLNIIKQREKHSGFLLLASSLDQLSDYITTPDQKAIDTINSANVPTSWITSAEKNAPPWLISPDGTIGFRITTHVVTKKLCEQLGHPITSTSANIKGGKPVSNTLQCHQQLTGAFDYLLTSNMQRSETPSVIRILSTGQQLR